MAKTNEIGNREKKNSKEKKKVVCKECRQKQAIVLKGAMYTYYECQACNYEWKIKNKDYE